ncbi:MAG: cell division protein CrgA [Rhodococcus sp.]|uniref:cell division protein CrgA n=1 Tax=Rhodococcus TaxID=1827 RepID=UPI0016A547DE|nr:MULTISPECIES: cell division protein CrgA [Rhodococcus]NLV79033.1 cell division protein CrgA [Rhodococcus sp. (in: high G+C Gram-positive bacteria)]
MPKSKVRKKTDHAARPVSRTPVKVKAAPSSTAYVTVMLALMVLGLLWLVVYYLAAEQISWMNSLGAYNFLIGFGFMVAGLIMTMKWR